MYIADFSPFLWQISENFGVRWYGFSYLLGFLFAYLIIRWLVVRQKAGMAAAQVSDFVTYGILGVLIGGRLGYCLFYSPDLFIKFKTDFPFWGVLAINEGGMSSHGGILGLCVACLIFAARTGISQLYLFDLVAVAGPVGIFFGRIANFVNGELVGRVAPANFPFSFKFPTDILQWPASHPEKLSSVTEAYVQTGGQAENWSQWLESMDQVPEARSSIYQGLESIVQHIQAGHKNVTGALAPFLESRYPSQLFAAAGEGLFLFLFLFMLWYKPRRPGTISALFLLLYGVIRIGYEMFREPDAHLGYLVFGMTQGQILSVFLVLSGIILLLLWGRRETLAISGWGRGHSVRIHRR